MSQIWLFFAPGVGGDGLANLLEHCHGTQRIDNYTLHGQPGIWRIHRIVDGEVKFWAPTVDTNGCFRSPKRPFRVDSNMLNAIYQSAVHLDKQIFVTSHDMNLGCLESSDLLDVFCKNQIKILLDCQDHHRAYINRKKKNLQEFPSSHLWDKTLQKADGRNIYPKLVVSKFDYVIYIEQIQSNFDYFKNFLNEFNLSIDETYYQQYIGLINGDLGQFKTTAPRYNSYIDDCTVKYYQTDTV